MTQFCSHCGVPIPAGARFCPRCGTVVPEPEIPPPAVVPSPVRPVDAGTAAPRVSEPVAPRRSRSGLIAGVLIALVALALIGWALLAGMPFGRKDTLTRATPATPDVVSEQQGNSGTVSQIGEPAGSEDRDRTVTTQTTVTMVQPPVTVPPPSTGPPPLSLPDQTSAPPAAAERTISEDEASNVLRGYVSSTNYYQTTPDCVGIVPMSYENRGYTIDVVDRCGDRGRLGRWRVDAMTREVFVRKADGRYLRP